MVVDMKQTARLGHIPASIEVSSKQALDSGDLPGLFPPGTRVYVTDIGSDEPSALVKAARRVTDLGYTAVPHFAARRLSTRQAVETQIKSMTQDGGVRDILVIGGDLARPVGDYASSMDVLESGFLEKYGISHVGVAGHPEGSPNFAEQSALEALRMKKSFGERSGIEVRIVTQFGFDGRKQADWAETLLRHGIDLPIHLGVAGPAKISTLVKYAAACGVGNSIGFLKKNTRSIAALATSHSPEGVVGPIETHWLQDRETRIEQIHVFPFGGVKKAAQWLEHRGTWDRGRHGELDVSRAE
ncbi:methylenetetrahydrofolate reductase [Amorphus sp. 3PC139-8]|uniref:methylenetetrahydrofolate reductase n=1 Tax=Amorphus sp. 3PC139-8 TaxID=2735676 RepID=UPI00345CC8A8